MRAKNPQVATTRKVDNPAGADRGATRRLAATAALVALASLAAAPALAATFGNATPIAIPGSGTIGPGNPFPSEIEVSGLLGSITRVTATLFGFGHAYPEDVGFLLVGPGGGTVVLMNGSGRGTAVTGLDITFDDAAASAPPYPLVAGTFLPFNRFRGDTFSAPAPGGPYGTTLSIFDGTDPNGTWSLFAEDFLEGDAGSLSGGWSLTIQTDAAAVIPLPGAGLLLLSGLAALGAARRRRPG